MPNLKRIAVIRALLHFFNHAPMALITVLMLSVLMSALGVVSMVLLVPLVRYAGLDIEAYTSQHSSAVNSFIHFANNLPLASNLSSLLIAITCVALLVVLLGYVSTIKAAKIQQGYVRTMRKQVYQSLLDAEWGFLSSRRASEYLHRVGAQVQGMNTAAYQFIRLLKQFITLIIHIGLMLVVNAGFTFATLLVGLIIAIVLIPLRLSIRDLGARQLRGYQDVFAALAEHLQNMKMIKASGREDQFCAEIDDISAELELQGLRGARAGSIISSANSAGLSIGFAVLLYIGVTYYDVPIAEFFILLMIMGRILPQLAGLQGSVQGIIFSLPAFTDVEKTIELCQQAREHTSSEQDEAIEIKHAIELKEVSFHYPITGGSTTKGNIFDGLNIRLNARETVALKGASGAGKTTIADLFATLIKPAAGQVLIDGQPITQSQLGAWRRSMSYVTQDIYLFNDSLRYNLTWPSPNANDQDVWEALRLAALDKVVTSLPNGLSTRIGDRGIRFSGGERQRLAIARALLMQPQFLILDEATSALDDANEAQIHSVIRGLKGKLTVLIIAHRESTLKVADRVIDVDQLRQSSHGR